MLGVEIGVGIPETDEIVSLPALDLAREDRRKLQVGHAVHADLDAGLLAELLELPFQLLVRLGHEMRPGEQFQFALLGEGRRNAGCQDARQAARDGSRFAHELAAAPRLAEYLIQ